MAIDMLLKFSVKEESDKGIEVFNELLREGESIIYSYINTRDKLIFTNYNIIAYDVKGMTGTKKSFRIFPYSKISSYMIETAGVLDSDCDFYVWISGVGAFEIKFASKLKINKIARLLNDNIR